MGYSIILNLNGKTAVVVGAGTVADRRIRGLLGQQASIRVVAPNIAPEIEELARSEDIELRKRNFSAEDLDGAFIVHAATSERSVNHAVAVAAEERGLLVCCADGKDEGNFITPSAFSRGDLTISVTTGGESPTLAAVLRERLEVKFGPEYDQWTRLFGKLRPTIQGLGPVALRKAFVSRVLDDPEVWLRIMECDLEGAETAARRCI